jgi:hypothetical protein
MNRMRRRLIIGCGGGAILAVVLGATAARVRSQERDLDVLKVIPQNYKIVLENSVVRVIEAHIPAGYVEPPHRHLRGVSVAMGDYVIEHRDEPGGPWLRSQRNLGTVYWSESSVHETRNVGKTDSHTMRIELKF